MVAYARLQAQIHDTRLFIMYRFLGCANYGHTKTRETDIRVLIIVEFRNIISQTL